MSLVLAPVAAASPKPPRGPGLRSGFLTDIHRSGKAIGGRVPAAYFRGGMNVYVSSRARHQEVLVRLARYAVGQLRRHAVDITYEGIAPTSAQSGRNGPLGRIIITDKRRQTGGCKNSAHGPMPISLGFTSWSSYPVAVAAVHEVTRSLVTLCPVLMHRSVREQRTTALHEFGHALGLGHFPGRYRGQRQIMTEGVTPHAPVTYQRGDINGLRYLTHGQHRLERLGALHGAAKGWRVSGDSVRVAGWAITGRLQQPTDIYLTADGQVIDTDRTGIIPRRTVARRYRSHYADVGFHLIASARRGSHRYCLLIADYTEPKARQTVACKTLTAAPPLPAAAPPAQPTERTSHSGALVVSVLGGLLLVGAAVVLVVLAVRRRKVNATNWPR